MMAREATPPALALGSPGRALIPGPKVAGPARDLKRPRYGGARVHGPATRVRLWPMLQSLVRPYANTREGRRIVAVKPKRQTIAAAPQERRTVNPLSLLV